ncbi:MAG TPA: polymer-forming cytoskeletal protein [bacterium]|nr:polymer-forming cytoskeletal protein [bacterium]
MRLLIVAVVLLAVLTPVASAQGFTVRVSGDIVVPRDTTHDGSAVAMNGHIRVDGTLRGDALAMNGDILVNGTVTGSVRTFNGNIVLGSSAVVQGDVWSANGRIDRASGSKVRGHVQGPVISPSTPAPAPTVPTPVPTPHTAPEPPPPSVRPEPWRDASWWWWSGTMRAVGAWTMVGFIMLAGVLGTVFPRHIRRIADVLHQSPGEALLAGVGLWVVLPPLAIVLALSIVGIPVVAFLPFIVMLAGIVGFAGASQLIGDRLLGGFQKQHNTALEAIVGAALLGVLIFIPGLGWLAILFAVTWGIGAVLVLLLRRIRRAPVQTPA